jgi:hypothetical protein
MVGAGGKLGASDRASLGLDAEPLSSTSGVGGDTQRCHG